MVFNNKCKKRRFCKVYNIYLMLWFNLLFVMFRIKVYIVLLDGGDGVKMVELLFSLIISGFLIIVM